MMIGPYDRWVLCCITSSMIVFAYCDLTERPRGVSLRAVPFYTADKDGYFACIDGSERIPFNQVNDDYCDCADSSDEPGTAACSEGLLNHNFETCIVHSD